MHIDFPQFKKAVINALNIHQSSTQFIEACENTTDISELLEEISMWIAYCKGDANIAAIWILRLVIDNVYLKH